jgi:hypothetical protein
MKFPAIFGISTIPVHFLADRSEAQISWQSGNFLASGRPVATVVNKTDNRHPFPFSRSNMKRLSADISEIPFSTPPHATSDSYDFFCPVWSLLLSV